MAESLKARGANFSAAELNQLAASWLHVSQDPIVGNGQKLNAFWDRCLKHYNDNRPADRVCRNVRSLETKWSEVKRVVAKFSGCFQTTVDANHSGTSLEDTIRKSKELYVIKDPKGKEFGNIEQWHLLRDCPRFSMSIDDMNQKAAQKKARKQKGKGRTALADKENDCPNVDNPIDLDADESNGVGQKNPSTSSSESPHFGEQRPLGNKVAKKQRVDESSTKIMAAISAKRLRFAEKQDRESILTMRVDGIDEECRAYFRMWRAKELKIAMLKLQREEEEELRALRGSIRTPLPFPLTVEASVSRDRTGNFSEPMEVENSSPADATTTADDCSPNDRVDDLVELNKELASP